MASPFTMFDLKEVSDYKGFESFCSALMSRRGYSDIEPLGGFHDEGLDAIHVGRVSSRRTIFAYSSRGDWDVKIKEDAERIVSSGHECDSFVFVTSSVVPVQGRRKVVRTLATAYGWDIAIYDARRIATLVDNVEKDLRQLHPTVFPVSQKLVGTHSGSHVNRLAYARRLIAAQAEWLERYTPLVAEHRDFESLALPYDARDSEAPGVSVLQIARSSRLVILLGESGAGKTTALWRIVLDKARALVTARAETRPIVPILISLRAWSSESRCRELIDLEFETNEASGMADSLLKSGRCLVMIDGLNELASLEGLAQAARQDIERLIYEYPRNTFLLTCRTSDYSPDMLDFETLSRRLPSPSVFEVRRLDRRQIADYIERQNPGNPDLATRLVAEIGLDDSETWRNTASLLHLARIPLYLQLLVTEYRRRKALPHNRADFLQGLIRNVLRRERRKGAEMLSVAAKERLLGAVAIRAVEDGLSLQMPKRRVEAFVRDETATLHKLSAISLAVTADAIFRELLSNNLWHEVDARAIEWTHQFIWDYFLGCQIAEIYTNGRRVEIDRLRRLLKTRLWDQPSVVALSLLDGECGASFLSDLATCSGAVATRAFDNASEQHSTAIARAFFASTERAELLAHIKVSRVLPYLVIVSELGDAYKHGDDVLREAVADTMATIAVRYSPLVAPRDRQSAEYYAAARVELSGLDEARIFAGVRRGIELLRAWSANQRNRAVQFYAAKGLWGSDRPHAAEVLRVAWRQGDNRVRRMVDDLRSSWNIE
jgi:ribose 1,5-bisphosphokinase PhnN